MCSEARQSPATNKKAARVVPQEGQGLPVTSLIQQKVKRSKSEGKNKNTAKPASRPKSRPRFSQRVLTGIHHKLLEVLLLSHIHHQKPIDEGPYTHSSTSQQLEHPQTGLAQHKTVDTHSTQQNRNHQNDCGVVVIHRLQHNKFIVGQFFELRTHAHHVSIGKLLAHGSHEQIHFVGFHN